MLLAAYRLIGVVKIGGRGRRAQSAGAARVDAVDVIEAVADAGLVRVAEVMIDLGEQVAVVHRVGIDAGGDLRAGIIHGEELRVDGRDVSGRDGGQARLIQFALLEVGEVKGAVVNDRTAEACAVLRLRERQGDLRQRISRIETLVLEIEVDVAMQVVGAALA